MDTLGLTVVTAADAPAFYRSREYWETHFRRLGLWPAMLAHDAISKQNSNAIDRDFAEFQLLAVLDGRSVVGVAHAVPLCVGNELSDLPNTGWDWALNKAISDRVLGRKPDALCGLSVTVLPPYQRRGVGRRLIESMIDAALQRGMTNVIVPVRPITKERWPHVPIGDFLSWRRLDGYHQDPWIRTHERLGGIIQSVCGRSMQVIAPIAQWRDWYNKAFQIAGAYAVRGAMVPIIIDVAGDKGWYEEPNIWMVHSCSRL
jgi:GNAT superfamily N-acetyltransferase